MPKMKTRKTLTKRVRVTKNGYLVMKQTRMGHLKRKFDSSRKFRMNILVSQPNAGHVKVIKRMLVKLGRGVKIHAKS